MLDALLASFDSQHKVSLSTATCAFFSVVVIDYSDFIHACFSTLILLQLFIIIFFTLLTLGGLSFLLVQKLAILSIKIVFVELLDCVLACQCVVDLIPFWVKIFHVKNTAVVFSLGLIFMLSRKTYLH